MKAQPWSILDAFDDIDDVTDSITKLYLSVWNAHALLKKRPVLKRPQPWMNPDIVDLMNLDIVDLIRLRNLLYNKHCVMKTDESWVSYKMQK